MCSWPLSIILFFFYLFWRLNSVSIFRWNYLSWAQSIEPYLRMPAPKSRSKSELLYNWWFTANQFILATGSLRAMTRDFFQLNSCCDSPYVRSSLMKRWVCILWICLAFCQVYISHSILLKILPFALHRSSVSTGFPQQIMPILCILCYSGSLVTWTIVSLTTTKFKPLVLASPCPIPWTYSISWFYMTSASSLHIIVYLRKVESLC
jgi:hypothetical protein